MYATLYAVCTHAPFLGVCDRSSVRSWSAHAGTNKQSRTCCVCTLRIIISFMCTRVCVYTCMCVRVVLCVYYVADCNRPGSRKSGALKASSCFSLSHRLSLHPVDDDDVTFAACNIRTSRPSLLNRHRPAVMQSIRCWLLGYRPLSAPTIRPNPSAMLE